MRKVFVRLVWICDVFWLTGHPGAKRCFAWLQEAASTEANVITVLEAPPIIGPATAVRAALAGRSGRSAL
jgi:hypothetical protein